MNLNELYYTDLVKEKKPLYLDRLFIKNLVEDFIFNHFEYFLHFDLRNLERLDAFRLLLLCYNNVKGTEIESEFINLLEKYNIHYSHIIHNFIYFILNQNLRAQLGIKSASFPGLYDVKKENEFYILDTKLGKISLRKASQLFKGTHSSYIFEKDLCHKCYERTYEFLEENKDEFKAVVSYLPNFFVGGHCHCYLKNPEMVLDIASDCVMSLEDADKVLNGENLGEYTFSEVNQEYDKLKESLPQLNVNGEESSRLHILALNKHFMKMKNEGIL